MKVKCYLPELDQIVNTFNAYSYMDLIKGIYKDAEDYKEIRKNENLRQHFIYVWDQLVKYQAYRDGDITDFIFINCS